MDNIIMKKITLILVVMFSLLSFTSDHVRVNSTQYDMRLTFIQDRSRMLEDMFEKQYEEGTLESKYAFFYMQMVRSLDSCAADLKHFKVLFK